MPKNGHDFRRDSGDVLSQVESRLLQAYVDTKTATLDDALQDFLPEPEPAMSGPLPSMVGAAAHELVNALVRLSCLRSGTLEDCTLSCAA